MIEVEHLSFRYGRREVLRDVSLRAEDGSCVGILGNNGVGKSTLITCINRIRTPSAGTVRIDGRAVEELSGRELARTVAYVAQKNELSQTTVFDGVLLGRKPYMTWGASREDLTLCSETLARMGLEHLQLRNLDQLSGGEVQKVMLARALVQQPRVLLLDEPTSNLDPRNQHEMLRLVRQETRDKGLTALIVLHDLNLALRYCDRFFFLKEGQCYGYGGEEIVDSRTIEEVYGVSAKVLTAEGQKFVMIGLEEEQ